MIICRPGYSSIMDLVSLGKSAILVPTPGQTEQEYLAGYLDGKMGFVSVTQKDLGMVDLQLLSSNKTYEPMVNDLSLLRKRIDHFLPKI